MSKIAEARKITHAKITTFTVGAYIKVYIFRKGNTESIFSIKFGENADFLRKITLHQLLKVFVTS